MRISDWSSDVCSSVLLAVATSYTICTQLKRTTCGNLRIQLAQASSSGVAGIGEGFAAAFQLPRIQRFEPRLGHVDFAAHLEYRRPATAMQLQWNVAYGAHVGDRKSVV